MNTATVSQVHGCHRWYAAKSTAFAGAASTGRAGLGDWVVRLYRDDADRIRLDLAPDGGDWDPAALLAPQQPAIMFNRVPLRLTGDEAKALQGELMAVLGRWAGRVPTDAAAPTHQLGLFLTPLPS